MAILVLRGPETTQRLRKCGNAAVETYSWRPAVELECKISVSQGYSRVALRIEPSSFADIALAMVATAPQEAIKAFGAALSSIK